MSFIDFQTKYDITHKKSMHIHHCCNILSLIRFLSFIFGYCFFITGIFLAKCMLWISRSCFDCFFDCCQGASSL